MFIYPAIKHYKELWRVDDRAWSECLKSVRAEAAIKQYGNGFAEIRSGNRRSCPAALKTEDHVPKAEHIDPIKSCLIRDDLHAQRDTSLLLLWRKSDGQEQSVSSSGTPRTGKKTSSSRTRKFSPSSSITTRKTRFMLKHPLRCVLRVQGCHHPFYVMVWWGGVHQGVTPFHFCEKGVKTGTRVYQEDVLQGVVKPLNATVFIGQKWVFQQKSTSAHKARRLRSGCGKRSGLYQRRGLALGESRLQIPGL